jgi:Tfp pilus assembly protein PilO
MLLIYILIIGFLLLIGYQLYLESTTNKLIEGLENETSTDPQYQPYNVDNPNNALILAQQNAGNIEVLRGRVDKLDGIKEKTDKMQEDMNAMQSQIDALVQQQADYAEQLVGNEPPEVSGTEGQTTADAEQFIAADDEEE